MPTTVPLKGLAKCRDDLRRPVNAVERADMQGDIPYWGANSVQDYVNEALVTGPTVLIGEDGAPFFDSLKEVAFFVDEPIWPNNHIHVLKPLPTVDPRWLAYALNCVDYSRWITGSTRDKLTQGDLMSIALPRWKESEQRAIADFLDREAAQVDAMIEAQRDLVAVLEERRSAVIWSGVTKGVDGAPTSPSGIQWIGDMPSHWAVHRLKNSILSIQAGVWGEEPQGDETDVRCVRVADFDRARRGVSDLDVTLRSVPLSDHVRFGLRKGDLLLEKSGGTGLNPVGFVAMYDSDQPAVCSNFIGRVRLRSEQHPRYWLYAHAASYLYRLTHRSVKQTTGIQNLDVGAYLDEQFPYPKYDEQQRIADHLDATTARIDAMIDAANESIALMQERRSALISAAVTGRIDPRTGHEYPLEDQ